ncbi:hypothetical protein [Marinifilum fragile]|uniref:hypothetical protein n=1 Tax=Marinifilum fragile TaxID=570161 RepID=UPI002AAC2A4C|nr:hypothetical protein [Marinifilum fragile]
MGFLSSKRSEKIIDGAIKGIDALFFTKEEKAQQSLKVADAQMQYLKTTLSENSARSLTRRYLALAIVGVFLLLILGAGLAYPMNQEYAKFLFKLVGALNTLVMMVAGFFFGAYMIGSHIWGNGRAREKTK